MKQLAALTGGAVLVTLIASCGLGFAASGTQSTVALRDVAIIILAIFSLTGSLILGAVSFGGAWAIGRFGQKAVAAVARAGRIVGRAEHVTQSVVERTTVRPVARTARLLTSGATFVRAAIGADPKR
ncbi:MAG: hypothetical protein ACR2NO_00745 [Chloroflexota bacterium]